MAWPNIFIVYFLAGEKKFVSPSDLVMFYL